MSDHQIQDAQSPSPIRVRVEKDYFSLSEVIDRWNISEEDILYLAVNNIISLSIMVFNAKIEVYNNVYARIPEEIQNLNTSTDYSGLLDLSPSDVFQVFRCGEMCLSSFRTPDGKAVRLWNDGEITVMIGDLLLKREERDRYELESGFSTGCSFVASADYRVISCNGYRFKLGPLQAAVVRELHRAALMGEPWQSGKEILGKIGSKSVRIADLFRSQPHWRQLIESNQQGMYRLNVDCSL